MAIARSRVTSQGQISIPAEIRRKLGIGPGTVLEWDDAVEGAVIRRAGLYSSEDIHAVVFGGRPAAPRSLRELKSGIRAHVRRRHASD